MKGNCFELSRPAYADLPQYCASNYTKLSNYSRMQATDDLQVIAVSV